MKETNSSPKKCAAIDALRSGIVNRYIAEHLTYGRDREVAQIETVIQENPKGSCQLVIGGYGVGKSHLCEVLARRFENNGYAVAKLEMGASYGRAENPHAVLDSIGRSIKAQVKCRYFFGNSELAYLSKAVEKPTEAWRWDYYALQEIHKQFPSENDLLSRYRAIRDLYAAPPEENAWYYEPRIIDSIPSSMTAANLAVASVNKTAHKLRKVGAKGIILLFDEAERSNFASSYYRQGRARDLMLGFALASANMDTFHLKHYQNNTFLSYRPYEPSLIHVVFLFTCQRGLGNEIARAVEVIPLILTPLPAEDVLNLQNEVIKLYNSAYNVKLELFPDLLAKIRMDNRNIETRTMVRRLVAALDTVRLNGNDYV